MTNTINKWQSNRFGLINFWFYEDQHFPFVNGRILLRGSNGSGKSVTMQNIIPLLLDGNISPERLDPFGSRDRKMITYLLDEDDPREERIGYLYLEFKRIYTEQYLTIGVGLRARKGKPLDRWYFSITDGRRIGHDFLLFHQTDERITLSRRELENRLGEGGVIFDRQTDYCSFVNREIFGFESDDAFEDMIDLLIQLRTPKLNKDFKPSVVSDILNQSLQPLSEDDLRPMSESIENMDNNTMNLKNRQAALSAAMKIQRALDQLNRKCLFDKANRYVENNQQIEDTQKLIEQNRETIQKESAHLEALNGQTNALKAQHQAYQIERESLQKSDAYALKQRESELSALIKQNNEQMDQKGSQLEVKKENEIKADARLKTLVEKKENQQDAIRDDLNDLDEFATTMAFDEHQLFKQELQGKMDSAYEWSNHIYLLEQRHEKIGNGLDLLKQIDTVNHTIDDLSQTKDGYMRTLDGLRRNENDALTQLHDLCNDWKESVYRWNGSNQQLQLTHDQLAAVSQYGDHFDGSHEFSQVKDIVFRAKMMLVEPLNHQIMTWTNQKDELTQTQHQVQRELNEWLNHKEPEPEKSQSVIDNRNQLDALGIPYVEFYKTLEFDPSVDERTQDLIEEALLEMGILDALVIDPIYKDQVLNMDPKGKDHYLFMHGSADASGLNQWLKLDDAHSDLFTNEPLMHVLSSISFSSSMDSTTAPTTQIHTNGFYELGILTGSITHTHHASYIGSLARERHRNQQITSCQQKLSELSAMILELDQSIASNQEKLTVLDDEYDTLPDDTLLRNQWRKIEDLRHEQQRYQQDIETVESNLMNANETLRHLRTMITTLATELGLADSKIVFEMALDAMIGYEKTLYRLKETHNLYVENMSGIGQASDVLESIRYDLDNIRYEMNQLDALKRKYEAEHQSVIDQLNLTDYQSIKQRLDTCIDWLNHYPDMITENQQEIDRCTFQLDQLNQSIEVAENKLATLSGMSNYLQRVFQAERDLDYVHFDDGSTKALPAQTIVTKLQYKYSGIATDDVGLISENVNNAVFENRDPLVDYRIQRMYRFTDMVDSNYPEIPSPQRMDITATYRSVSVGFDQLIHYLQDEINALQDVIKEEDRRLFEEILANTISIKIRERINASKGWVENMNRLMERMDTSSGLKLRLQWHPNTGENEAELDTKELVELLTMDPHLLREDQGQKLISHFRYQVDKARKESKESVNTITFNALMKQTLDYRNWFRFRLLYSKDGSGRTRELTNNVFGTFSGGEKAMAMYVPLFSAVAAKYDAARADAPRVIPLDEAFAGVDNRNIRDMFRLMSTLDFDFLINSQSLWGDCDTLDGLAIYQLVRPGDARFITVMPYVWNGIKRISVNNEEEVESMGVMMHGN